MLSCFQDLAVRTKTLAERAHEIQTTGLTGIHEKAFRDLEEKLAQARGIVNARNATAAAVATLMELIEDLRYGLLDSSAVVLFFFCLFLFLLDEPMTACLFPQSSDQ